MDIIAVIVVAALVIVGFKFIQRKASSNKKVNPEKVPNNALWELADRFSDIPDFSNPEVAEQFENVKTLHNLTYDDILNVVRDYAIKNGLPTDNLPANGDELQERMNNL
jgi:hypothetical protein